MGKILEKINEQMNFELESGYIYLSMAAYLKDRGFDGMSEGVGPGDAPRQHDAHPGGRGGRHAALQLHHAPSNSLLYQALKQ